MDWVPKKSGYIKSFDGTPIYYELRGSGPPLVFVYGIACLMNHWHHQVSYFSKNFTTISFDLRGHHKSASSVFPQSLNIDSLAQDLIELLRQLEISSAHFLGHSFGVPVLLKAYEKNPEIFKSMVFINGFAKNPIKNMFGMDVIEPFFYFVKSQFEKSPDLWSQLWRVLIHNPISMRLAALAGGFNLRVTHFKDIEVYTRGVAQMDLNIFLPLFEELMRFDGDQILSTIKVPVLIMSGENDNITPRSFQIQMNELIQGSEFVLVPYGSHCTQLDFPDYVNLRLEKFLTAHT